MVVTSEDPPQKGDLLGEQCGGSYIITSPLGEGGMGIVYRAVSALLAGKEAAVKVLHQEVARKPEAVARFRAEVYAAGRIIDPNIVRVFDAGTLEDGRLYMMMEYCAGGSLASLLEKQGPLPFDLVVTIMAPICSALDAAHNEAKITHRDIKPANILLVSELGGPMRAKLADFGIAKLHDAQLEFGLRTGTKKILGSPGYMAPEQCAGRAGVDHRVDIYALGSLLYEAVTGQRPYPSNNLFELINNTVHNAPYPRPSELRRDLPPEWENVILACLAHRREDRIQSVKEVIHRLARATPNGEALMGFVAPRLVDHKIAPTAITITDGIGPAATQWATHWSGSDAYTAGRRRNMHLARTLATLGLGALLGGGAVGVVMSLAGDMPAGEAEPAVVAPPPGRPAVEPPDAALPLDAARVAASDASEAPRDAALAVLVDAASTGATSAVSADAAVDAARVAAPSIDAAIQFDAAVMVMVVPDASVPRPPPPGPGSSGPRADKPVRVSAAPASPGTLRVIVDPWADVTIAGRKEAFTTPGTIPLPAGTYRVVLTKGTKKETIDVKINPNQVTTITRTW